MKNGSVILTVLKYLEYRVILNTIKKILLGYCLFFNENTIVLTELNDKNIVDVQKKVKQEERAKILLNQLEIESKLN